MSDLDDDFLPELEDLVSICAGLVTIDKESNIVRLVHYTTQEYFERKQKDWFPDAESGITIICVTYLSFSVFESGYCQVDDEFVERLRLHQLYDYASYNWGHHARKASTSCHGVIQFLEKRAQIEASSQALMAVKKWSGHINSQQIPKQMAGLHLAAYFGVDEAVRVLSSNGPDLKDSYGRTPLWWAAAGGHKGVVKLLLETGKVDADVKDKYGQTPLSRAAERGHEGVVKLLLETGKVDADVKDQYGRTPLWWASTEGQGTRV